MALFRRPAREPLAVTMAGVKLGDRLLAVGITDTALIAALATRAGLTGRAAAVDANEARVREGAAAIEREGALVEVSRTAWDALPFDAASFDVAIIRDLLPALAPDMRTRCLGDVRRVLRPGGRLIVVETTRSGIGALVGRRAEDEAYASGGGAAAALEASGFVGVRLLAEREGARFVEGARHG
jgi:ubiquinone/menaquinone biosynthesis C-methylase UbiE